MTRDAKWSGSGERPAEGTRVVIRLNGWNMNPDGHLDDGDISGTVVGYENRFGYWMAEVKPDSFPPWWVAERKKLGDAERETGLFAGCELEVIK